MRNNGFGLALADERKQIGLAQNSLALRAETTQRHLSFLETGRSRPTRGMIIRLSEALNLSSTRRAALFEAAGFMSPYKSRELNHSEIQSALITIERQVLANWPFPAFALTPAWTILPTNEPSANLLGTSTSEVKENPVSFFELMLADSFRNRISNWDDVQSVFYARLKRHAQKNASFVPLLQKALENGVLAADFETFAQRGEIPAIIPIKIQNTDGSEFEMTSLSAHFTSAHDDIISDIEIELMVPLLQT